HQQVQLVFRRPMEWIPRIRLARGVLESRVLAEPVLLPHRVVERQRDARLAAEAVKRADGADLTGRRLVRLVIGVEVIQDVQEREPVFVLWEIEEAPMRAFDLLDPELPQ